jgi:hypothetical protein
MFHLVQYAYVPSGMPAWVAEGTANLFAFLWQRIDNPLLLVSIDRWVRTPATSLFAEDVSGCDRCYGGVYWWGAGTVLGSRPILRHYFELLRETSRSGQPIASGLFELRHAFQEYYEQTPGLRPLAPNALFYEFDGVSEGVFFVLAPKRPPYLYTVRPDASSRRVTRRLAALSTHYVKLRITPATKSLEVRIHSKGTTPHASLFLGLYDRRCETNIVPRFTLRNGLAVLGDRIVARVDSRRARTASALMITSTSLQPVTYTLEYRALPRREALLGTNLQACGVS